MGLLAKHWSRIAVTLIPLVFALLDVTGILPIGVLQRLDDIIYDARLRATMPRTVDERIVIVDIDEKSLADIGRWPWSRNQLASLVDDSLTNCSSGRRWPSSASTWCSPSLMTARA
jgi:adenylate cyclase